MTQKKHVKLEVDKHFILLRSALRKLEMSKTKILWLVTIIIFMYTFMQTPISGRPIKIWSFQELNEKADLVITSHFGY